MAHRDPKSRSHETVAVVAGIAAFLTWGLIPGYWKMLRAVPATEILAHRYVWTFAFLTGLLTWQRRWPEVRSNARSTRTLAYCIASGCTISINWFLFIWAVLIGRIIETSLGYFMTPLVNVLFGALFLGERLTRLQILSVLLALGGVLNLTFGYGHFPWIALLLCVSFGVYGLLRKKSGTAAIPGLFFETVLLTPIAILYLLTLQARGQLAFGHGGAWLTFLLLTTGIVTAVPLVWFGHATRHLRLTTVGFLQYLSPTVSFLLGVFVYHEPFSRAHLITFSLIWIALIMFTVEAITRLRADRRREVLEEAICDAPV
ncbi:MAG TPA: EamA family transporter RarD [Chthoniobacterales bacterium]|nr:EamA family transporter RarD [Chthoniobacterales bacterium]